MMVVVMTVIMKANGEDGHPRPASTTRERGPKMKMTKIMIMTTLNNGSIMTKIMRTNGEIATPGPRAPPKRSLPR